MHKQRRWIEGVLVFLLLLCGLNGFAEPPHSAPGGEDQRKSRGTDHLALPVPLARKSCSQPNAFRDASNRPIRRGKDRWSWLGPEAGNRATAKSSAQEEFQE